MKINKKIQKVLVLMVPLLILIGMCGSPVLTMMTGTEIKLKTHPVDPTDLFRGSYVSLKYDIQNVPAEKIEDSILRKIEKNDSITSVYVILEKDKTGIHTVDKVVSKKPDEGLFIKGEIPKYSSYNGSTFIEYHLDRQYAPKEEAMAIETAHAVKPGIALVKVRNGKAILKEVIIEK